MTDGPKGAAAEPASDPERRPDSLDTAGRDFADLVSTLPIGVYRTTSDGKLLAANGALLDLYGCGSLDELCDALENGTIGWYADTRRRDAFKRLMESWGAIDRLVSEIVSFNGSRIWVSETARAVRDDAGDVRYFEGAMQDISDLLSVQRALRESERRFRDYAEVASDWFWEMDENYCFSYFSDSLAEETGIDPRNLLGKSRAANADGDPDDPLWRAHIETLKARKPFYDFRYPMRRADGETLVISTSGIPVFDDNGIFRGYRGVGSNVTSEAQVQQSLYEAKLQAEFANRAKSEFIANVSHELRTPLNAILGFSDIMRDELFGEIGVPRYKRYLEDIHTSASHLLSIINMILDLSKIEAGKLELDETEIDLKACIDGTCELIRPMAREHQIWIEPAEAAAPSILRADERALRQMLLNLLSNAIKFSEKDQTVHVSFGRLEPGGELEIAVTDRGAGIPEDKLDLVTQPFGHSENPMSKSYEGSGLGLAITRRLVELHGGRLAIESAVGQGTTVRLVFPAERC